MSDLDVRVVGPECAPEVHAVILEAFADRPEIDPPADALSETVETVAEELRAYGGVLATLDGAPVGSLLFDHSGPGLMLRRFSVTPAAQGHGVAGELLRVAEEHAMVEGFEGLRVKARVELPASIAFWEYHGYARSGRVGVTLRLAKVFPRRFTLATADDVRRFGRQLAGLLRRGDLLLLSGDLGAGKTTLTQGIGAGLAVRGDITSPTFVIARVHPPLHDAAEGEPGHPALVHVDAYRLGGIEELDDLDLDTSLADAVTVVEWGEDVAEGLADERLEIRIVRATGGELLDDGTEDSDPRELVLQPIGLRWLDAGLADLSG